MRYFLSLAALVAGFATLSADDIKGKIVFSKKSPAPKMEAIDVGPNQGCLAKGPITRENFVIDPKTGALANVFVWIEPMANKRGAPFPPAMIDPKLAKNAGKNRVIDQPCCMFEPRVLAAREGDTLTIKNSAAFAHNGKYTSANNGEGNPLIASGGKFDMPAALVAEKNFINLSCTIHGWMEAYVMVFDHPYYAVTGKDGSFDIKGVMPGKYKLYVRHESSFTGGKKGALEPQIVTVDAGKSLDLGELEFEQEKK